MCTGVVSDAQNHEQIDTYEFIYIYRESVNKTVKRSCKHIVLILVLHDIVHFVV